MSCRERKTECIWDTMEGISRTADLKRQIDDCHKNIQALEDLIRLLRSGTDDEATMILAKLRLGYSVESLVRNNGNF